MNILAIDDNKDILQLLRITCTGLGHRFTSKENGRDGLDEMRNNQFDAVFLDLYMPEFSGVDVVKALDKEGLVKKQKIILFTASSVSDGEIDIMIKNGVHSCLRKPVDLPVLREHLENIMAE